ncbi:MAG: DUF3782 domain-containing protein [Magnetococcales bacterium]|nr:DUF3782 domain-containing protein [Magnetococcales bacterium]
MSQAVTFDDVWKMFQETAAQMKETDRKFQEMVQEDRERRAELDRKFQETDRQMQETDRLVKEVSRQVGNLGSRWGEFVEGIVSPACEALFAARGILVREVHQRVKAKLPGNRHLEIDLLAVDGDAIVPIEVKSRLRAEDVRDFIQRLGELKEFMPRYADARVLGAVAGIVVEEGVDRYAMNEGLFVIVQSGDSVKLANDGKFVPRTW